MASTINLPDGPDPVLGVVKNIEKFADDFQREYSALYDLVAGELANNWKGSDYDSFKSKMDEEKIHFDSMYDVIVEYHRNLRNAIYAHVGRKADSENKASEIEF